jgi:hypothetical protein
MSSQLKMQQSELESSRQLLQGRQGVIVASLEAQWLIAGESRLWENYSSGVWNHTAWDSCWSAENTSCWWGTRASSSTLDVWCSSLWFEHHQRQPPTFAAPQPSWVLFSVYLFHDDTVPDISTNELKFCCKHGESGLCSCWCIIVHAGCAPRLGSRSFP